MYFACSLGHVSRKNFRQKPHVKSEYSISVIGAEGFPRVRPSSARAAGRSHARPAARSTQLGSVSGAHVNPAVTLGLAAVRKIRPNDAVVYILLEIAFIGAVVFYDIGAYASGSCSSGAPACSAPVGGSVTVVMPQTCANSIPASSPNVRHARAVWPGVRTWWWGPPRRSHASMQARTPVAGRKWP